MGAVKELWMIEQEQIAEEFLSDKIDFEDAVSRLKSLGLDEQEAREQLQELTA